MRLQKPIRNFCADRAVWCSRLRHAVVRLWICNAGTAATQADIWSSGIMLFVMLSGRYPVGGTGDPGQMIDRIRHVCDADVEQALRSGLPPSVSLPCRTLLHCLLQVAASLAALMFALDRVPPQLCLLACCSQSYEFRSIPCCTLAPGALLLMRCLGAL